MDSLPENIRKEASWQMMFADDVVLCAREKDVLEEEESRHSVDGITGGRCQESYATRGYHHTLRERYTS